MIASIRTALTYDPAALGAIDSLEFSFDLANWGDTELQRGRTGRYRPAFRQNGQIYYLITTNA